MTDFLDPLKEKASRLAELFYSGVKDPEIDILKQELNLTNVNESLAAAPLVLMGRKDLPVEDGMVGIWKKQTVDQEIIYQRDSRFKEFFHLWNDKETIPAKTKKRIVLLGESVARGYFYEPYYTPALVLEDLLNEYQVIGDTEVIDLAMTNMDINQMKHIYNSAFDLDPDMIVIFGGNNWHYYLNSSLSITDYVLISKFLQLPNKYEKIKGYLEARLKRIVTDFLKSVAAVSKSKDVPVLFVIPEFNLLDWTSGKVERILSFPDQAAVEWRSILEALESSFNARNIAEAERLAQQLIGINGFNPLGHEWLAKIKLEMESYEEARSAFENARDTALYRRFHKPRRFNVIRDAILEEANDSGMHYVDMKEVFKTHLSGMLPGKELFLDYCHLTVEGIQIAMLAAAEKIVSVFTKQESHPLQITPIVPSDEIKGLAHFSAAIHNAHWGRDYPILFYHCCESLKLFPEAKKMMNSYANMVSFNIPWLLSTAHQELKEIKHVREKEGGIPLLRNQFRQIMDIDLVTAIVNALKDSGVDIQQDIEQLRIEQHGLKTGKVNLLNDAYHITNYDVIETNKGYFQAYDWQSDFYMVCDDILPVTVDLTYRSPEESNLNRIIIKINNSLVAELEISDKWCNHSLVLPSSLLRTGVNVLSFEWPIPLSYINHGISEKFKNNIKQQFGERINPLYGELHRLVVSN